ncbi:MAG: 8-oxo-dGTP diphosphatase [Clostridia bacterium]|nr:8-oxo-dGTP diphosphatase [Clostridia bacterium]
MKRITNTILTNMCMIENDKGEVVVQDRVGKWCGIAFPGGHVEKGESFHESVIREIKEETGLTISNVKLCGIKDWYDEKNDIRNIILLYKTKDFEGELLGETYEGKVFWTKLEDIKNLNTADSFLESIEVFTNDHVNEFFFEETNTDHWKKSVL